ncbi:hypothetical protein ASPZODRAFT_589402 [Penicilliopsis zonata CBS 506.65]|uniref:M-phase inducer phosphatase n=1 Tax=Penicilliopsis zonata CBS 506.65 TaxID=1073090 RepID=A0A1L9SDW5_9EURO|nr:hypothetical protein ASPZODRAFT_589402 [Penicilliopsis zonata CBS 506.65]OJJ45415.1 hypothetical protein ASPZODRAFT_589402 [Penicilliopsis zonata CBS 506.65]
MTTPPLPSSSPAPTLEIMDMSPLPHKIPYIVTTDVELKSPTPDTAMESPTMTGTPSSLLQASPMAEPQGPSQEKRRPTFLRPSLARSKAQSFQLGLNRPAPESRDPPFKFGPGSSGKGSLSATASLEDMFGDSPPSEKPAWRSHVPNNSIGHGRLRPPFSSNSSSSSRGNGSPGHSAIRKNSHPSMRPRKQCRRSLSMFEHPEDVILEKEATYNTNAPLQSIADIEGNSSLQLPHFIPEDQADNLPRIEKSILVDVIDGKFNDRFDNIVIVDCRFEYEYEGGHINGAVNYNDKEHLAAELFADPKPRTALILHCEYSAHRAPIMAKYIRHRDRAVNVDHYPQLSYPEMYILDGGYSAFFAEHRSLCFPQNYVEMNAKEHEFACERGLGKVKQRSKLNRAQTFAFGQHSPQMEDSPTGRCRNNASERNRFLDSPFAASPASNRFSGRRMLSY